MKNVYGGFCCFTFVFALLAGMGRPLPAPAQVLTETKITRDDEGAAVSSAGDRFGSAVSYGGEISPASGIEVGGRLAVVGAPGANNGEGQALALRLNDDLSIEGTIVFGFVEVPGVLVVVDDDELAEVDLQPGDGFGTSGVALPAVNVDDAVAGAGAPGTGSGAGAFYLASITVNAGFGGVSIEAQVRETLGDGDDGLSLTAGDRFGEAAATFGDANGDSTRTEIAVGAPGRSGGGAVYIFSVDNSDASATLLKEIGAGNLPAGLTLSDEDRFGGSFSLLDDLDDDASTTEFAVGAPGTEGGQGAVYVFSAPQAFFMTDDSTQPTLLGTLGAETPGLSLSAGDALGAALANLSPLDPLPTFAVGAPGTGGQGAVYTFIARSDRAPVLVSTVDGADLAGGLAEGARFGAALSGVFDDPDGNGLPDLLVGSSGDAVNGADAGAAYGLFLNEATIPVELAAFTAQQRGTAAVLTWTTLTETNSEGFYVEHRPPGVAAFVDLGFVSSAAPGGTATEAQPYQFTTGDLVPGAHTFRLRQVDLDGTPHYPGDPVRLRVLMRAPFALHPARPNPFQNETTLQFAVREAQPVRLSLYDLLGRRVRMLYDGVAPAGELQTVSLRGASLAPGRYFVRLAGPSSSDVQSVTLVK